MMLMGNLGFNGKLTNSESYCLYRDDILECKNCVPEICKVLCQCHKTMSSYLFVSYASLLPAFFQKEPGIKLFPG